MAARIGDGATFAPAGVVSLDAQTQVQGPQVQADVKAQVLPQVQADVKAQVLPQVQDGFVAQPQPGIMPGGCFPPPHPTPLPPWFPLPPGPFPLPPGPFPLPEPMPLPLPQPIPLPTPVPLGDASVAAATQKLDQLPSPISGEQMAQSIKEGTQDLDNSAAGQEYQQFSDWAAKNQDKLSPEAKEVMKVYEKYAKGAQAQGQTGIASDQYDKMCKEMTTVGKTDVSAKQAIDELSKGDGKISGEDLTRAIEKGTSDLDNHSAGAEFDQFAKWAAQNPGRLSPEAKQVMDIYKKYADGAKAQGLTGISAGDYQKMLGEMKNVHTYKDESAGNALDKLNHTTGPVSGKQMLDAIQNGTQDLDGQAAGTEMQDILAWARDNAARLSPDAKKLVAIYAKYATQAILQGGTGIDQGQYQAMLAEMKRALVAPPPRPIVA